jgi:hypothetical protein
MFDIVSSRDFLSKLEADYADFKSQPDSARHALNCIITAYHLTDWVWGDLLMRDDALLNELNVTSIDTFKAWLDREWPGFGVVQKLTNGTKHFIRKMSAETQRIAGYGCGPFGVGPYGKPYLLIDYGADKTERWQTAEQLLNDAVTFWRRFFGTYHPENIRPA